MDLLKKTEICALILETTCRIYAPKDTGNLSINAIKSVYEDGMWQVVIGGELAPYAVYTNEAWISEKWKGAQNPNEGWIQNAIEAVRPAIIGIFEGTYTEEEIAEYQNKLNILADELIEKREKGVIDFDIRTTV